MVQRCEVEGCNLDVFRLAEDNKCIFHTETGKIKGYEKDKPIFIKPQERTQNDKEIVKEFIKEFQK